ncbi:MAG: response regulator transcription factor [Campylobacteraceae bacterium]
MKILLLEDNQRLNQTIVKRLQAKGFKIDSFTDGLKATKALFKDYACYILDINVPNVNGIEVLKKIREKSKTVPVLIISSSVELDVIRDSYNFGCDDYIKKPFFIDELEIKVEKLCQNENNEIEFSEDCFYDFETGVLTFPTYKDKLSKKEKLLFELFLKEAGNVITYENIIDNVWKEEDTNLDAVRSLVRRIRKKLPEDIIETIVDVGYMLIGYKK